MKLLSKLLGIIALSAIFFSCNDDDCDCGPNGLGTPISLSSRVTFEQRIQETQIVNGQSLSFFVTSNESTSDVLYNNYMITANGNGGFTYQQTMYYPLNDDNVDFYAIHPYNANATLTNPVSFTVTADQSDQSGYLASDLLHATRANVERQSGPVSMTFSHMLAKIDISVVQGVGGVDITGLENVQIENLLPTTSITPSSGTLAEASGTATSITPYGIPVNVTGTEDVEGITAIVVPQTIPANQTLLRITIDDVTYAYAPNASFTFRAGYRHGFVITVNATGIDVSSTINPWLDGGSIGGDGSIE